MNDLTGQTSYAYNEEGEITGVRQGDGSLIQYQYDDYGNVSKMIYPDGSEVSYRYDDLDRLIKITDRDGQVTTYEYNKAGDMPRIERGDGSSSELIYDNGHRVTDITHRDKKDKLISHYAYTYDDGNYITKEIITQNGETIVQTYSYDSLGQLSQMEVWDKDEQEQLARFTYTYDLAGNKLTSTETSNGKEVQTTFTYDADNRLTEMKIGDELITYSYDQNGNRISSHQGDETLDHIYDTENRLLAVKDKAGLLFAALYDGDHNRVFTASRTEATTAYQLFKRKPADKKRKSPYTASSGEEHSLFWYGFTQNVVQFFSSFSTSEGYDWIGTFDTISTVYHKKVAKDRATKEGLVVTPPNEDNLPGEDPVVYSSEVTDVLIPYTTKEDHYHYYETRNYVNDVNRKHTQVLQTYDDHLNKRESYSYGYGRSRYTNETSGDSYNYLTNRSGSVTGLTQNGQSVASSSYGIYGSIQQTTDTTGNPFAYNGEARDATGLDYLRARYYDSQAGSFLTADSYLGSQTDPLSQNLYAYVQNNPVNYTDPSGHKKNWFQRAWDTAKQAARNVYNAGKKFVVNTYNAGKKAYNSLKNTVVNTYNAVKTSVNHAVNWIGNSFNHSVNIGRSLGNAVSQAVRRTYNGVSNYVSQTYQSVRQTVNHAWEQAKATGQSVYNWGTSKTREADNIVRNWTKSLEETIKHVCEVAAKASDRSTTSRPDNKALFMALLANYGGIGLLGFLSDRNKKKGLNLFGTGSVEVEFPELGTSVKNGGYSLYQKTKVSSAIDGGGMINLNWTNGWQPSINFNFEHVSGTIGLPGNNFEISGSLASGNKDKMTFSDNVSISMGLDGLSYSSVKKIENKNGGVGMGTGINLNLDTNNGVLGGYQISESISKSGNSTITTQTQSGIRTGDSGQLAIVGLIGVALTVSPGALPATLPYIVEKLTTIPIPGLK